MDAHVAMTDQRPRHDEHGLMRSRLAPRFPRLDRGTQLVLIDGAPGQLRVFWNLASDDLLPAAAGFRHANGGVPKPVLRVRRISGPRAGLVSEVPVRLVGPSGQGDQRVDVGSEPARYTVELGLSDGAGGWLMLARSNALDLGAQIGISLPSRTEARADAANAALSVAPTGPQPVLPASHGGSSVPERRKPPIQMPPPPGVPPLVLGVHGPIESGSPEDPRPTAVFDSKDAPLYTGPESDDASGGWSRAGPGDATAALGETLPAVGDAPDTGSSDGARSSDRAASPRVRPSPTAPMIYGQVTPRAGTLIIEAELRVNGCAAPGSRIDLFGVPFRVGPGGRFQVSIRVEDPTLIRRAFELNPPQLPQRDDD
jgi:hypothetical protein